MLKEKYWIKFVCSLLSMTKGFLSKTSPTKTKEISLPPRVEGVGEFSCNAHKIKVRTLYWKMNKINKHIIKHIRENYSLPS